MKNSEVFVSLHSVIHMDVVDAPKFIVIYASKSDYIFNG